MEEMTKDHIPTGWVHNDLVLAKAFNPPKLWIPTQELRLLERKIRKVRGFGTKARVLQQKWVWEIIGMKRGFEWRDVPVVKE